MKRILSLLLALVMVLTLFPVMAPRAEAKTGGKLVALTFDDGPSSKYTPQLLDGLKDRGVPVTFFILGQNAVNNRSIVRRAYEEGHEIACHTWNHLNLNNCTESKIKEEVEKTFEELDRACGDEADYLVRPPYGNANQKVRNAIDVPLIYWSVDSEDWSLLNTEKVRSKIVADTYDGSIILCHDIHKTTIPAALQAIDDLMDLGYEFVTVSELFRRRGRELEAHKLHYNSNKNGTDYGPIPAPKISFSGDPKGVNTVTISCSDKNVPLYYTLDGSYPNQSAKRYTGPFTVPYGTKVTAVAAYKLNGSRSALTVKTANQIKLVAPTITLNGSGDVVMSTPTANAEIRFTVNDTPPGSGSLRYAGPETIAGGCYIRAVTVHEKGTTAETRVYLSEEGNLYYDIYPGTWYYDPMDWCYRNGYISGIADYTLNPAGTVTRGMMVMLLYAFSGDSLGDDWERTNTFKDVKDSYYYAEAIEWAYRNQIVSGYSEEYFAHKDVVTRQQMCTIMGAFLAWNGTPLHKAESAETRYDDYDQVFPWARASIDAMVAAGMVTGDGRYLIPNASSNRAQFCTILAHVADYIENYVPEEEQPECEHAWKLNLAQDSSMTWSSETIDEGESLEVRIECSGCGEIAPVEWEADPDGVVLIEENTVTGILGGTSAMIRAVWEEIEYECLIYVRESEGDPTDPTEPEPTESETTEPVHVHTWKLNKQRGDDPSWGEVSIDVGEKFRLYIFCTECKEVPEVEWTAEPDGVVLVEEDMITGMLSGKNARVRTDWDGKTYECLIHVRKDDSTTPTEPEPTEPEHVHDWKLNKASSGSETTGDVSIDVGDTFTLRILCKDKDCTENAPITWTPSKEGVVKIDGMKITGVKAGYNTTLSAEWEGETYSCIIRVRKNTNDAPIIEMPF